MKLKIINETEVNIGISNKIRRMAYFNTPGVNKVPQIKGLNRSRVENKNNEKKKLSLIPVIHAQVYRIMRLKYIVEKTLEIVI